MPAFRRFTEDPSAPYRMGRHQVHDALPPELEAAAPRRLTPIRTVRHKELLAPFDQGRIGSCTANAAYGTLSCQPFAAPTVAWTEDDCVDLYRRETRLDDSQIPGHWEPDDTGSTGPWSMTALQQLGRIRTWHHTRRLSTALRLLMAGPVSIGVTWYQSMFTPDPAGLLPVDPDSGVAGGHQVCLSGVDAEARRVYVRNSWGTGWGLDGHAWLSWQDLDDLLEDGGDVVQPVL